MTNITKEETDNIAYIITIEISRLSLLRVLTFYPI